MPPISPRPMMACPHRPIFTERSHPGKRLRQARHLPGDVACFRRRLRQGNRHGEDDGDSRAGNHEARRAPQSRRQYDENQSSGFPGLGFPEFCQKPRRGRIAVYRKGGGEDWKKRATTTMGSTAYVDSGVAEKVPYSYRVTAVDSSGNESAPSPEITATFMVNRQAPKLRGGKSRGRRARYSQGRLG